MSTTEAQPGTLTDGPARGRGAQLNPDNRFDRLRLRVLDEHREHLATEHGTDAEGRQVATEVYRDATRTAINRVDSPDLGFRWTLNPYRGCEHGCIYCYARPGHEYLSLSSGVDFESKIFAKPDAPSLLRKELADPKWEGEPIVLSGVTDPFQPVEARMRVTRQCMEVMAEARQPVSIVTKSRLVLRDMDLLEELARHDAVSVAVSVTTLDNKLAAAMEPRAAAPRDRLWTIRRLASIGVPVTVMAAPLIPAVNDREAPQILKAAREAGASSAAYVLLRLPHAIKDLFDDWLRRHFPQRRSHVQKLLRESRNGKLYDAEWGTRMRGTGAYADQLEQTFRLFAKRYGLTGPKRGLSSEHFRPPAVADQLPLFAESA